jgi:GxxExxY protein
MDGDKIVFKELSYQVTGLLFKVHNELGRYCRERQYGDVLEERLRSVGIPYEREKPLPIDAVAYQFTNKADFVIDSKLLLELKAKSVVLKDDYYQVLRYLDAGQYKLGMIVNFRNKYLKPIRVIRAHS